MDNNAFERRLEVIANQILELQKESNRIWGALEVIMSVLQENQKSLQENQKILQENQKILQEHQEVLAIFVEDAGRRKKKKKKRGK